MRNELYHHGIKGQRWGIRRYQNADGSLTPAGKARYSVNIDSAKARVKAANDEVKRAKKEYNRASLGGLNPLSQNAVRAKQDYQIAQGKTNWEKSKLSDEKAKAALNKEKGAKSKHRLQLEQHYRKKGMSDEEAEIAAYKRARTEKILAVVGGVTVAAAAAYAVHNHLDKNVDRIIRSGTVLQNMSNNSNKGIEDAFYASLNRSDNNKYRGLYGMQLFNSGKVYETKIGVKNEMRVASEKNARKILSDMVNNGTINKDELSQRLKIYAGKTPTVKQDRTFEKAISNLDKGIIDKNVYDAFNMTLPYNPDRPELSKMSKKFYNELTSKGYDAIMDVNDKRYSGYQSKAPIIAFNTAGKAAVDSSREVGIDEIMDQHTKSSFGLQAAKSIKQIAASAAVAGGMAGANRINEKRNHDKIVANYKREHPNTTKSYNEIIDMYYEKKH